MNQKKDKINQPLNNFFLLSFDPRLDLRLLNREMDTRILPLSSSVFSCISFSISNHSKPKTNLILEKFS